MERARSSKVKANINDCNRKAQTRRIVAARGRLGDFCRRGRSCRPEDRVAGGVEQVNGRIEQTSRLLDVARRQRVVLIVTRRLKQSLRALAALAIIIRCGGSGRRPVGDVAYAICCLKCDATCERRERKRLLPRHGAAHNRRVADRATN